MSQKEFKNNNEVQDIKNNNSNIKVDRILLEEELRCPICKIIFDSNIHIPFVISCGHTFCKQCIFNNSNNKCPIDSNVNSFKMYIRNIQLESIVNKILINNKEFLNQQKMVYIKPDIKNNKLLNNIEDNNKNEYKERTNRNRGKSINQRSRKNDYKINSPSSIAKNYNKKLVNKQFKSPNVNVLKGGNKFNDIINYDINTESENKLNFIEDNFKLEDEKIDDILINETIGTIPIYEEKSLTNSIREDFNDLLNKNEIYNKKRIIYNNNINANNNYVSPIKRKADLDINENFFNEQNKKIILLEDQDFVSQKPLRLSNHNLKYHQYSNDNRQMTEINHENNIKQFSNSNKTEKKENKDYQKFYTSNTNTPFNFSNRNIQNKNEFNSNNNKGIKTIFDYIKSINKLSSNNNGNNLNKNINKSKEDFFNDSSNNINKRANNNKGANIININNYNNNLRISLQEKHLDENDIKLLKTNIINSPINCQKYIKVRASSKIPKKNMIKNNENIMNDEKDIKDNSLKNKKLKQIKVKKENNDIINNINIYTDKTNKNNNSNDNSNNSSLLYNKKKINSNNNIENNNNNNLSLENTDVKNDKNDMNRLSIRQTVVKNRNIMGNANRINITISPNKNTKKLDNNNISNQKLDFSKTINKRPLNLLKFNNNESEINNIIRVGEYLSKNKIEKSRSVSSNKNKTVINKLKEDIISNLKSQYDSLKFSNISQITKKKYDQFFQNPLNIKLISESILKFPNTNPNLITVLLTQNDNLFIGELDPENNHNPKRGVLLSPNMDYFEGEFISGKKEGKGKLIYNNGTEYVGNFKNNKPDGYGQLTQENGEVYQGEWKEGKINGHGTRFHKNGDKYIGNYVDNIRNGYGIYIFSNGNTYEGNWVKGKANGKGIFKYNNGNEYEGEFKNNLIEGKGKLMLKNGDIYEGNFINGTIHGQGCHINSEGEKYVGEFKKGKKDGKGKLIDIKGNIIQEGLWREDEFLSK